MPKPRVKVHNEDPKLLPTFPTKSLLRAWSFYITKRHVLWHSFERDIIEISLSPSPPFLFTWRKFALIWGMLWISEYLNCMIIKGNACSSFPPSVCKIFEEDLVFSYFLCLGISSQDVHFFCALRSSGRRLHILLL